MGKGQTKEVLKTTGKEIQRKKSHFLPYYEPSDMDGLDDGPLMMDDEDLPPLSMDDDDDGMDISQLSCDLQHENEEKSDLEKVLNDDTKSPLVVNRCLYRAHRNLRLAVLEASKRFEEIHQEHILATAKQQQEEKAPKQRSSSLTGGGAAGAGLVLRHGLCAEEDSEALQRFLSKMKESKEKQAVLIAKAQRQSGRGKRNRKKVVSDLAGMMGSGSAASTSSKSSRVVTSENDNNAENTNNTVIKNESSNSDQMLHHSMSGPKLGAICEKEEFDQ